MAAALRAPLHCHRCIYSWRPRSGAPRVCPRCKSKLWNVPKIRPRLPTPTGLGIPEVVRPHRTEMLRLARRYGIASLRVFGSVARGEAHHRSDVDLLYEPRKPITLLERVRLRLALQEVLGRKVDLCRVGELRWSVKPQAVADAVDL
jgi:uncharacterized protein